MYGQRALELLQEAAAQQGLPLVPYKEETIRHIIEEVEELYRVISETVSSQEIPTRDPYYAAGLLVHHQSILRNKRCVLAYLMSRLQQIQTYRWEIGSVLPEPIRNNMSTNEKDFSQAYDRILGDYMVSIGVDLTMHTNPPKDLYIEVRVLKDYGEIMTDNGSVRLVRNTTHYLLRTDVEHLIRQGILEHVI
eukprot:TRINITY_DN11363_c0_g1_i1.p1 TRINITY_DN11363_c0_g1~~TRINITY_DN11363_c0_g1_i1.p1  ORF type:complete len:192 (+),score=38.03 TRINITY_DN11363_c0_g1_i1:113-688(+)